MNLGPIKQPSPSGARVQGDDYQYLLAVQEVAHALRAKNVKLIGIEDPEAGHVDDVTVYFVDNRVKLIQSKYSVDASVGASIAWLMAIENGGKRSIIKKMFDTWKQLRADGRSYELHLYTNKPLSASEPLLKYKDGIDGSLAGRLFDGPGKNDGACKKALEVLATHLGAVEWELRGFLGDLHFRIGRDESEVRGDVQRDMFAAGLRCTNDAVEQAISIVRKWVKVGKRRLSFDDVRTDFAPLVNRDDQPKVSVLIQAVDHSPTPEDADISLDWVDLFQGNEPRERRLVTDPAHWNGKLRPELQQAAKYIRSTKQAHVMIHGFARLPTWFTSGTVFGKTAGFDVSTLYRDKPWSSKGPEATFPVCISHDQKIGEGSELAIAVAVSADPTPDALPFVVALKGPIGRFVTISPVGGVSDRAFEDADQVRGWAKAVRDTCRDVCRDSKTTKVHLFLAIPSGASLLLGHLWDRIPKTQLYEDLGSGAGYAPSFEIPN